jgi:hypothetical protein
MILGFFFVRPVPLPKEELNREVYSETNSSAYGQSNSGYTPLLNYDHHINGQDDDDAQIIVELNMSPNVHGKKLWCSSDFWLLCSILSIRTFACLSIIFVHL